MGKSSTPSDRRSGGLIVRVEVCFSTFIGMGGGVMGFGRNSGIASAGASLGCIK